MSTSFKKKYLPHDLLLVSFVDGASSLFYNAAPVLKKSLIFLKLFLLLQIKLTGIKVFGGLS